MSIIILIILSLASLLLVVGVSIFVDSLTMDKEIEAMKDYCEIECKNYKKLV